MARRRRSSSRQLTLPLSERKRVFRHTSSVEPGLDDWLHDRGEHDPSLEGSASRALTDAERRRALRFARRNYKRNGCYGSILGKLVEHTLGDGVEIGGFEDAEVEAYVRGVLDDRRNAWDDGLEDRWRDTLNEGEFLLTLETQRRNPGAADPVPTGLVRFGRFEVEQIKGVRRARSNPDRILELEIELEPGLRQWFPVAIPGAMPAHDATLANGEVVALGTMTAICYWSVSRLAGRGSPRLLRILEKAELVDDVVDSNARKAEYLNRFWLTGEYKSEDDGGEKDQKFEEDARDFVEQGLPGSFFLTSKGREFLLKVFAPDLKVLDQKALYDMVVEFVLGSEGIPRAWFGSSGETNRATAVEQGSPVHRMLISLQARLQQNITDLVEYLIWLGKASGRIRAGADETFEVQMAAISTRDTQREVGVLQQLASFAEHCVRAGLLHEEEAQAIVRGAIAAQTMFEVKLQKEPPDPTGVGAVADVLNEMPEKLRESIRKLLPGHRRMAAR